MGDKDDLRMCDTEVLGGTVKYFQQNMARVRNLLEINSTMAPIDVDPLVDPFGASAADLLRSAIVFLHATLEEFLRGLALARCSYVGTEFLKKVPLVGGGGSAAKFSLGELAEHRGKSVHELIDESVRHYLDTWVNFSSTDQISAWLKDLDIRVDQVNGRFGDLQQLMERRHHIVHQADRGLHGPRPLKHSEVENWADAVDEFVSSTLSALGGPALMIPLF